MNTYQAFQILNLSHSANLIDIKQAYRHLATKYHPDHGGNNIKMQELNEAYFMLSHLDGDNKEENNSTNTNIDSGDLVRAIYIFYWQSVQYIFKQSFGV